MRVSASLSVLALSLPFALARPIDNNNVNDKDSSDVHADLAARKVTRFVNAEIAFTICSLIDGVNLVVNPIAAICDDLPRNAVTSTCDGGNPGAAPSTGAQGSDSGAASTSGSESAGSGSGSTAPSSDGNSDYAAPPRKDRVHAAQGAAPASSQGSESAGASAGESAPCDETPSNGDSSSNGRSTSGLLNGVVHLGVGAVPGVAGVATSMTGATSATAATSAVMSTALPAAKGVADVAGGLAVPAIRVAVGQTARVGNALNLANGAGNTASGAASSAPGTANGATGMVNGVPSSVVKVVVGAAAKSATGVTSSTPGTASNVAGSLPKNVIHAAVGAKLQEVAGVAANGLIPDCDDVTSTATGATGVVPTAMATGAALGAAGSVLGVPSGVARLAVQATGVTSVLPGATGSVKIAADAAQRVALGTPSGVVRAAVHAAKIVPTDSVTRVALGAAVSATNVPSHVVHVAAGATHLTNWVPAAAATGAAQNVAHVAVAAPNSVVSVAGTVTQVTSSVAAATGVASTAEDTVKLIHIGANDRASVSESNKNAATVN